MFDLAYPERRQHVNIWSDNAYDRLCDISATHHWHHKQ